MAAKKKAKKSAAKKAKPAAKKAAVKKAAPKTAAGKKAAAKKAAPTKSAPKKAAPTKSAPKKAAPKKSAPKKAAPTRSAPNKTAPKAPAKAATTASSTPRFCWHDLMTTDVDKAREFYANLLPWKTRPVEMQPLGVTQRIEAGGAEVGGLVSLPSSEGISSHWMPYVEVRDLDAVVRRAKELGGYVPVPPTKLEGVGRFAVIADPRGAHVSPIQLERAMPANGGPPQPGHVSWNEVVTDDVGASARFFAGVFGWGLEESEMPGFGKYVMFVDGKQQLGGVMKAPMENVPPHWLSYWTVNDLERALQKAKERGAQVPMGPMDLPNIGKIAVLVDPTGASFALHQPTAQ